MLSLAATALPPRAERASRLVHILDVVLQTVICAVLAFGRLAFGGVQP